MKPLSSSVAYLWTKWLVHESLRFFLIPKLLEGLARAKPVDASRQTDVKLFTQ